MDVVSVTILDHLQLFPSSVKQKMSPVLCCTCEILRLLLGEGLSSTCALDAAKRIDHFIQLHIEDTC